MKSGTPLQFAPQSHASVAAGWQYPALAKNAYGVKELIWAWVRAVIDWRAERGDGAERERATRAARPTLRRIEREGGIAVHENCGGLKEGGECGAPRAKRSIGEGERERSCSEVGVGGEPYQGSGRRHHREEAGWHADMGIGQLAGREDVSCSFVVVPNLDGTYRAAYTCEGGRVPASE